MFTVISLQAVTYHISGYFLIDDSCGGDVKVKFNASELLLDGSPVLLQFCCGQTGGAKTHICLFS